MPYLHERGASTCGLSAQVFSFFLNQRCMGSSAVLKNSADNPTTADT